MGYSLTFTDGNVSKNTLTDWGLTPETPPTIPPPTPVTNFVDIPGRPEGPLDLSRQPWGRLMYTRMSGSWNFLKELTSKTDRKTTYEAIRSWLHGRSCKVTLEDDPDHYFVGMFLVGEEKSGRNMLQVSINYNLVPIRYRTSDDEEDANYVQT